MYRQRRSRRWYRPSLGVWLLRAQSEIGISKLDYNEPRTYRVVTLLQRVREHIICSDIKANGTHDSSIKRKNGFHFCCCFFRFGTDRRKNDESDAHVSEDESIKGNRKKHFPFTPTTVSRVVLCAPPSISPTTNMLYRCILDEVPNRASWKRKTVTFYNTRLRPEWCSATKPYGRLSCDKIAQVVVFVFQTCWHLLVWKYW